VLYHVPLPSSPPQTEPSAPSHFYPVDYLVNLPPSQLAFDHYEKLSSFLLQHPECLQKHSSPPASPPSAQETNLRSQPDSAAQPESDYEGQMSGDGDLAVLDEDQ